MRWWGGKSSLGAPSWMSDLLKKRRSGRWPKTSMLTCFFLGGLIIFYLIHVSIRGLNIWAHGPPAHLFCLILSGRRRVSPLVGFLWSSFWGCARSRTEGGDRVMFLSIIAGDVETSEAARLPRKDGESLKSSIDPSRKDWRCARKCQASFIKSGNVWNNYLSSFFDTSSHSVLQTQDLRMTCRSMSS